MQLIQWVDPDFPGHQLHLQIHVNQDKMPSLMVRNNLQHFKQLADNFYKWAKTAKHNNKAAAIFKNPQQLIFHSTANGCCTQLVLSVSGNADTDTGIDTHCEYSN